MEEKFLKDYFQKFISLINFDKDTIRKLLEVKKIFLLTKKRNKKGVV